MDGFLAVKNSDLFIGNTCSIRKLWSRIKIIKEKFKIEFSMYCNIMMSFGGAYVKYWSAWILWMGSYEIHEIPLLEIHNRFHHDGKRLQELTNSISEFLDQLWQ